MYEYSLDIFIKSRLFDEVILVIPNNNYEKIQREIKREYVALVWGKLRPQHGRIETLLTRSKKNRQLMSVSAISGKKANTNYKTLKVYNYKDVPKMSLVECKAGKFKGVHRDSCYQFFGIHYALPG